MVRGVVVQVAAGRLASWKHRAPSRPCPQVGQVGGGVEGTIGPDQLWPLHQQRPGLTGRQATRRNLLQETAYFNQEDKIKYCCRVLIIRNELSSPLDSKNQVFNARVEIFWLPWMEVTCRAGRGGRGGRGAVARRRGLWSQDQPFGGRRSEGEAAPAPR